MEKTAAKLMKINNETLFLSCLYFLLLFLLCYVSMVINSGIWSLLYHFETGPVLPFFSLGLFCIILFWLWGRLKKRDIRIITLVFFGFEALVFFVAMIFAVMIRSTLIMYCDNNIPRYFVNFLINMSLYLLLSLLLFRKEVKAYYFKTKIDKE